MPFVRICQLLIPALREFIYCATNPVLREVRIFSPGPRFVCVRPLLRWLSVNALLFFFPAVHLCPARERELLTV